MSKASVNPKIISVLRKSSKDDKITDFLMDILHEEAEHIGKGKYWQYSDTYKRLIKEYSEKWGDDN